jgi:hypothetical protein
MTSSDSLLLLLRRLDEIERKLDCMLEGLQTPTAIGYGTPGQSSKEGLMASTNKSLAEMNKSGDRT